jgi:hypothetical protein
VTTLAGTSSSTELAEERGDTVYSYIRKSLPFALCDVRKYFLSGDLNQRTIAILTLLDSGYHEDEAFRLMRAFDENLTAESWGFMVRDARILDDIRRRPRLGEKPKTA